MTEVAVRETLDSDFVRQQYPALTEGRYKDIAFFENAGGTYVPKQVIDQMEDFLINTKVQPYGPYAMSEEATNMIETATVAMAEMINADASEIVIGHSTTMNLVMLAKALRPHFKPGDEVIVTNQDHESNISPWRRLERCGAVIKEWQLNPITGELEVDDLIALLSTDTKLVCIPHSSNIVGSVNDVKRIAGLVHECDAMLLVDGVSYAPHHALDMQALGVDFYTLSLYKVFGPHLGLLYVKQIHHDKLQNQSLDFMPELYASKTTPGAPNYLRIALNPGLVNHESVASLIGLVNYFNALHKHHFDNEITHFHDVVTQVFALITAYETQLAEQFLQQIPALDQLQLIGKSDSNTAQRSPTYSFRILNDQTPLELAQKLAAKNIAVQGGCFYAWRCLQALKLDPTSGVLRISFAHFNTSSEIDFLIKELRQMT